jgi:hypothetical protein
VTGYEARRSLFDSGLGHVISPCHHVQAGSGFQPDSSPVNIRAAFLEGIAT